MHVFNLAYVLLNMGNLFSTPPIDDKGLTYKRLKQTHFYDQGSIRVLKENGEYSTIEMEDVFNFYSTPEQIKWFIRTNIQLYVDLDEKRIAEDEKTLTKEEKKWVDKFKEKEKGQKKYLDGILTNISKQKAARLKSLETNRKQNRIAKVTRKTTDKPKAKRKLKF